MINGKLKGHIILSPVQRLMAIEALRVEKCDELADMLEGTLHSEIPPSAVALIMGGVRKLAAMGRTEALQFIEDYQNRPRV